MNTYSTIIEKQIKKLIEKNIDARKGFENASKNVKLVGLTEYFESRAKERSEFISQLIEEAGKYGCQVSTAGSAAAGVHRTWMDIKKVFATDIAESQLEEARRGEKLAIKQYDKILLENLPLSTRELIMKQRTKIAATLGKVAVLEDAHDKK